MVSYPLGFCISLTGKDLLTPSQLEHWVLSVLDRLRAKEPTEDLRVEIKTEWPSDISKVARRIAGHANAAQGESVLWIIGADEKNGVVVGAGEKELADWWPQVQSQFDGIAPDLMHLIVPTEPKAVVALLFDTTRAPFVVKNPTASAQFEVPWRDATGVRSARRSDLIRLLVPLQHLPDVAIRQAKLDTYISQENNPHRAWSWSLWVELYIVPLSEERIVLPFHRCGVTLTILGILPERSLHVAVHAGAKHNVGGYPIQSLTITGGNTELVIDGPGSAYLTSHFDEEVSPVRGTTIGDAVVRVTLQPVHTNVPAVVEAKLAVTFGAGAETPKWAYASG